MKNILGLISVAVLLVGCGKEPQETAMPARWYISEADAKPFVQKYLDDAPQIVELMKTELPGIENDDDLTKSIRVRNLIYHKTDIYTKTFGNLDSPLENLQKTLSGEWGHLCAGMSFTWQTVMFAFGIETRYVGIFTSTTPYATHAVAEMKLDGKWVAVDTTFNNMYVNAQGEFLSYQEMREMKVRGEQFFVDMNGQVAGRPELDPTIVDVGMNNYLNVVAVFPGPFEAQKETYLPGNWNGVVVLPNTGAFLVELKGMYYFLNHAYMAQAE